MGVMYKIVEGNLPEWPATYSQDLKEVFEKYVPNSLMKKVLQNSQFVGINHLIN